MSEVDAILSVLSASADSSAPEAPEGSSSAELSDAPPAAAPPSADVQEALAGLEKKVTGPSEDELRAENLKLLQEKRARLAASRDFRKQKETYEGRTKQVDDVKTKYEAELNDWGNAFKDPKALVGAFQKRGVDPFVLHQQLTDALLGQQSPEVVQRNERQKFQEETLGKVTPEVKALKEELASMKSQMEEILGDKKAHMQARADQVKTDFVEYLEADDASEELFDYYTTDQLYEMAQTLDGALRKAGMASNFKELRSRMVEAHRAHMLESDNRRKARMAKRNPTPTPENSSETKTKTKGSKTISSELSGTTATSRSDEDEAQREQSYKSDLASILRLTSR